MRTAIKWTLIIWSILMILIYGFGYMNTTDKDYIIDTPVIKNDTVLTDTIKPKLLQIHKKYKPKKHSTG